MAKAEQRSSSRSKIPSGQVTVDSRAGREIARSATAGTLEDLEVYFAKCPFRSRSFARLTES
jgi:hypothetical protein